MSPPARRNFDYPLESSHTDNSIVRDDRAGSSLRCTADSWPTLRLTAEPGEGGRVLLSASQTSRWCINSYGA